MKKRDEHGNAPVWSRTAVEDATGCTTCKHRLTLHVRGEGVYRCSVEGCGCVVTKTGEQV